MAAIRRTDTAISFDAASRARLSRLEEQFGGKSAAVREALLQLELQQSFTRDLVRDMVLEIATAVEPDGRYDPAEDPRPEEAALRLASLLGSMPAAEGIVMALRELSTRRR